MQNNRPIGSTEATIGGAGCLFAIPIALGVAFWRALKFAQGREHQFSHQVEEVELEGAAAAQLEEATSPAEALARFVKKLRRVTAEYSKTGAKLSPQDYKSYKQKLSALSARVGESDAQTKTLVQEAQANLQQYAPPGV